MNFHSYKIFDKKKEDCRKVILTPGGSDIALPEIDSVVPVPAM